MKSLNKKEAQQSIDNFFARDSFSAEEVKKIRRLAMKHKVKLGTYRKSFCKKCLSQLKGTIKITKTHKTVVCENCTYQNKFRLS